MKPTAKPSRLWRLDPRTKLMMMASVSTLCLLGEDVRYLLLVLCGLTATLLIGGAEMKAVWKRCRTLFGLILSLFLIQSFFAFRTGGDATPLLQAGDFVFIYREGVLLAMALSLRLVVIVLSAQILLEGARRDYLLAFTQMHIPYEIAFMVTTGIHFLPILREEARNVYCCMQLRGLSFRKIGLRKRFRAYARLCLPIFASTLRRAEEMAVAMEIRGLRAYPTRTYMRKLCLRPLDVWLIFLWPLLFTGLFLL